MFREFQFDFCLTLRASEPVVGALANIAGTRHSSTAHGATTLT
jgi:hypothetical protein